jgi:hypothetical protein
VNFPVGAGVDPGIGLHVECWKQGHDTSFWVTVSLRGQLKAIFPIGPQELQHPGPDMDVEISWTPDSITIEINGHRKTFKRTSGVDA